MFGKIYPTENRRKIASPPQGPQSYWMKFRLFTTPGSLVKPENIEATVNDFLFMMDLKLNELGFRISRYKLGDGSTYSAAKDIRDFNAVNEQYTNSLFNQFANLKPDHEYWILVDEL
jgi:hypothetical protein